MPTYNQTLRKLVRSAMVQEPRRITQDPDVMGGKACIHGVRVTVGMILGLLGRAGAAKARFWTLILI